MLHDGNLENIDLIAWDDVLNVDETYLCRHGIAASFEGDEKAGFICVFFIEESQLNKIKSNEVYRPENGDIKGESFWIVRLRCN